MSSVSPPSVAAGGPAFTMTVLGSGFSNGSTVQWNGSPRSTQYVSATELLAQVNAPDIAATGSASITVTNPQGIGGPSGSGSGSAGGSAGGSTTQSNAKPISIVSRSVDATAYQIDPAHDGAMTFGSVDFPASPTWRVSLGTGTPSNIVIADGKVFLTTGTAGGSQLMALGQTNGATAWSPQAIAGVGAGTASLAYDSGRVFVSGGSTLFAYDAATGALDWSTGLAAAGTGAPTAADGLVYVNVTGNATIYALDEATGAISWQHALSAVSRISAVTADGLYVTAATAGCPTLDLRPATGEVIWDSSEGTSFCPQTANETPIVANQLVYSPNSSGTSIFSAQTGSNTGTLAAPLPAAFTGSMAYFPQGANLDAVDLSNSTVSWTFNGDGTQLTALPIVVNQYVITGTAGGNLYAVDGTSGALVWTQALGGQVQQLSAGDGLLLVLDEPASGGGGTLTAYTVSTNP
ncbi:MAG: PQQ-binding-like beta-propeller repeat protein [Proteobacteria bacterium]|nr:PQQ-binding-like beta-propeller repeat protein [Pseudomonadota bacterium]